MRKKKKLKRSPIRDQQPMEFCSNIVAGDVLIFLLNSDKTISGVLKLTFAWAFQNTYCRNNPVC